MAALITSLERMRMRGRKTIKQNSLDEIMLSQCHSHDVLAVKGYCDEDDSVDNLPGSDDGDEMPKNKVELEDKGHLQ